MRQKYFDTVFGSAGTITPAIPDAADPNGFVSYSVGFTFDYQRNLLTDPLAKSPTYINFNAILSDVTGAMQALQQQGNPEFITAAQNGGTAFSYRQNAMVAYSASGTPPFTLYMSAIDNNTDTPGTTGNWINLQQSAGAAVAGEARNAVIFVGSASATTTFTADELVVAHVQGGAGYKLNAINAAVNLATVGAGGMDTGTAPISGYVAKYLIYNPTTNTTALLATNATTAVAPNVYAGTHMPAGYTASALVSVWPTNSSGQLVAGLQRGRRISIANAQALITSSVFAIEALSIASIVPPNAARVGGSMSAITTAVGIAVLNIYAGSALIGVQSVVAGQAASEGIDSNYIVDLSLAQNIYCSATNTTGTPTFQIFVSFYEF